MKMFHRKTSNNAPAVRTESGMPPDLWSRFFRSPFAFESHLPEVFERSATPAMNVSENEQAYVVTLEVPGMNEEDFDVQVMGHQLVISGERRWKDEEEGEEFHRVESQFGRFERSLTIPDDGRLDSGVVEATYDKGLLTIRIPKVEPTPSRRVKVRGT